MFDGAKSDKTDSEWSNFGNLFKDAGIIYVTQKSVIEPKLLGSSYLSFAVSRKKKKSVKKLSKLWTT